MIEERLIPRPTRYLLRFDDLCPTISRESWQRWRALVEEFRIRPILAVVPDNQDPELQISTRDPEFWSQMRTMERSGSTIGLHGFRHLCKSHGRSLVPVEGASEFAGVSVETQRAWIQEGLRLLRRHGLEPKIWVAPRHGFDRNTLWALRAEGIQLISDGLARCAFARDGFIWIPQQLWASAEKPHGLWTICVHPNTAGHAEVAELRAFMRGHARQFTSVDQVLADLDLRGLTMIEKIHEEFALWRRRMSQIRRHLRSASQKHIQSQAP